MAYAACLSGQTAWKAGNLCRIAAVGGWPGARVAQRVFRHKTRKPSFLVQFWLAVAVNMGAVAWLFMTSPMN